MQSISQGRRSLHFGTSFLSTLFAMAIAIAYSVFLSHCFAMACWRMCESFHLKKRHIDFCLIKEQAIAKQCGVITKKPRLSRGVQGKEERSSEVQTPSGPKCRLRLLFSSAIDCKTERDSAENHRPFCWFWNCWQCCQPTC